MTRQTFATIYRYASGVRMRREGKVHRISHDGVNRFVNESDYREAIACLHHMGRFNAVVMPPRDSPSMDKADTAKLPRMTNKEKRKRERNKYYAALANAA